MLSYRYGYLTNTKVKFILVTTDLDVRDADVRNVSISNVLPSNIFTLSLSESIVFTIVTLQNLVCLFRP